MIIGQICFDTTHIFGQQFRSQFYEKKAHLCPKGQLHCDSIMLSKKKASLAIIQSCDSGLDGPIGAIFHTWPDPEVVTLISDVQLVTGPIAEIFSAVSAVFYFTKPGI